MTNEELAAEIGRDRKRLKSRLQSSLSSFNREVRKKFGKPTFDFENKRLISEDGTLCLQWQLRQYPDQPESPKNQQCSVGIAFFKKMEPSRVAI